MPIQSDIKGKDAQGFNVPAKLCDFLLFDFASLKFGPSNINSAAGEGVIACINKYHDYI